MQRLFLIGFAFASSMLALSACGGTFDSTSSSGSTVVPGSNCSSIGARAAANDGCNTCSCTAQGWACTEMACNSTCTDGDAKGAADGCNSCSCSGGQWLCTMKPCPIPECPNPAQPPAGVSCTEVVVYARSPLTGTCCMYGTACAAPEGWQTFASQADCEGSAGCTLGDTMPAGDGCNSCTCTESGWDCTYLACPVTCSEGQTKRDADGCNVCTCGAAGQWACTDMACTGNPIACGARSGDTCTDDEYCAYEEGAMCGAADASSTCKPRPQACDTLYAPVCGCDGNTYGNSCEAAAAGTGVNTSGDCAPAL